jgi:transposase-like protein
LWKWFLAVYVMGESRKGISANQLKRMLGVSYKTAWFLCHRIRSAMHDDNPALLNGIVEIDETYIGGKARGRGQGYVGNKTMVMGAIERGGKLRVQAMPETRHLTHRAAAEFFVDMVDDNATAVYTDESNGYPDLTDWNTKHRRVNHSQNEWVRGDVHTNTVESAWSLFDRAVIGAYHKLSVKHLPAYLDEFQFRFNNRNNPFLFRDTILALVEGDALTFAELTKKPAAS